ncbi:MAG: alpha-N-arabinofuranosidase [Anaerolineae bacterium]|nr:alpha-N-arabinofuranosidase [Anaerolineae bacterium]
MKDTTINLHSGFQIGPVDPRIFGGFLEHMGRAVYQGVYDPDCAHADEDGFRTDVLDALKRLQYTVMRYPGGNFVSGYHWTDGIGPREQRPTVRDLAWQSTEPNLIGTDEYITLCRKMNWTPMLTVNLGTGTPEEARNWVEYCNSPTGTKYADWRMANGNEQPHGVKLWCLGNEMDGPWQLGHVPADQYAIRAQQAAKMMRDTDSSIEMVACGSCNVDLPTYLEWDRQVLEYMGQWADYISLHRYVGNENNDTLDYLAVANSIDRQIEQIDAICRYVQGKHRSPKRTYLCFDEWNVWYRAREQKYTDGQGKFAPHLIEEVYNLEDALVVAGFLNSFIRHADVLKIANLAQIVNVIAPILTEGDKMLIQSIFYPLEMYAKRRTGISLQPSVQGPAYEGKTNGQATYIDPSAILNHGQLNVFATNRHPVETATVHLNLADGEISSLVNAELLTGPEAATANSFEQPHLVQAQSFTEVRLAHGQATVELPPLSVLAVTLQLG